MIVTWEILAGGAAVVLLLLAVIWLSLHLGMKQSARRVEQLELQVRALQATTKGMGQVLAAQSTARPATRQDSEPSLGLAEKHLLSRLAEFQQRIN